MFVADRKCHDSVKKPPTEAPCFSRQLARIQVLTRRTVQSVGKPTDQPVYFGVSPDRDIKVPARDAVLNAAEIVIDRDGVGAFTLDAVAKESGVSKGGLLHHYPSKDALLLALVTRMSDQWRSDYEAAIASVTPGPARVARGLLNACIADAEGWNDQMRRSGKVMVAAMVANPLNVKPAREAHENLMKLATADGGPAWASEAIVFAMHGLWFSWLFGLIDASPDRLAQVRASLQKVVERVEQEAAMR